MHVKTSVIMPAFNEGKNIVNVLERLRKVLDTTREPYEIIVINDGSTDDTSRKVRDCGVKLIDHKENLGYGRALKDGIRASLGESILQIDSDGTYDIDAIPKMLRLAESADLVIGKRIFSQKSKDHFKNLTRRFFANLTSYYANKKVEDLNSGQRVYRRRDVVDKLESFSNGFSFTSTMTVQYLLDKKNIVYTPITYSHRDKESKFISASNIFTIAQLAFLLTFRVHPFKLSMQMAALLITAALLSRIIGSVLKAGRLIQFMIFLILYPLSFLIFLCYIYVKGRMINQCHATA